MRKLFGMFVFPLLGLFVLFAAGNLNAEQATGRQGYNTLNRAGNVSMGRMPVMPVMPITTTGNITVSLPGVVKPPVEPPVEPPIEPPIKPECKDGGVKDSKYTVRNCMNDVLLCVNTGALPGGLNDLFNEDLRNAIVNGMNLCSVQVDKCITEVRKDCTNVYRSLADVWVDFNSRVVQPEYYSFVLRKTGLTPYQAENTCRLLDKNTFGSAFTAVDNSGNITAEYANRIGAYNEQAGGVLVKKAPQGVKVNDNNPGVDGQRGHYARWDATTADCHIRVAAYNNNTHIKNSWLFGALGDDKPAEVWKKAGDIFSCNKDLFGFSLMNDTSTVAVMGVGGGTVLGAGVGALAGHGKRDFDCENNSQRNKLTEELKKSGTPITVLNQFFDSEVLSVGALTKAQCLKVVALYYMYHQAQIAVNNCTLTTTTTSTISIMNYDVGTDNLIYNSETNEYDSEFIVINGNTHKLVTPLTQNQFDFMEAGDLIKLDYDKFIVDSTEDYEVECDKFNDLKTAVAMNGLECFGSDCVNLDRLNADITRLKRTGILESVNILGGEKSNILKTTFIGAGVGAATGGVATAITAFVERSNISCQVGDGLEKVGFGKSHSIGSLKDFYVKWELRLPDTLHPTMHVIDCNSWKTSCAKLQDIIACKNAQVNYKPVGANIITLIDSACMSSGSVCVENDVVARSYGACMPEVKPEVKPEVIPEVIPEVLPIPMPIPSVQPIESERGWGWGQQVNSDY